MRYNLGAAKEDRERRAEVRGKVQEGGEDRPDTDVV